MNATEIKNKLREAVMAIEAVSDGVQESGVSSYGWLPTNAFNMVEGIIKAAKDYQVHDKLMTVRQDMCNAIKAHGDAEPKFRAMLLRTLGAEEPKKPEPVAEKRPSYMLPTYLGQFVKAVAEAGRNYENESGYCAQSAIDDIVKALVAYATEVDYMRRAALKGLKELDEKKGE